MSTGRRAALGAPGRGRPLPLPGPGWGRAAGPPRAAGLPARALPDARAGQARPEHPARRRPTRSAATCRAALPLAGHDAPARERGTSFDQLACAHHAMLALALQPVLRPAHPAHAHERESWASTRSRNCRRRLPSLGPLPAAPTAAAPPTRASGTSASCRRTTSSPTAATRTRATRSSPSASPTTTSMATPMAPPGPAGRWMRQIACRSRAAGCTRTAVRWRRPAALDCWR
jgi:hypothetical protein